MIQHVDTTSLPTDPAARTHAGRQGFFGRIGRKLQSLWGGDEADVDVPDADGVPDALDRDVSAGPDQGQTALNDGAQRHLTPEPQARQGVSSTAARAVPGHPNAGAVANGRLDDTLARDVLLEPDMEGETEDDPDSSEDGGADQSAAERPQLGRRQQRAAEVRSEHEAAQKAREDARQAEEAAVLATQGTGPVGCGEYVVQQGECFSSIAPRTGHLWETLWDHPANESLKKVRKDPNVLLPDDKLTIPPIRSKHEGGETEMRHRFVLKGEQTLLRLALRDRGNPIANAHYVLKIEHKTPKKGQTDDAGMLEASIPSGAMSARLSVAVGDEKRIYELHLGHIDPITEVRGVQARLNNLGFAVGQVDNILGSKTLGALNRFRSEVGLPGSRELDDATRTKLEQAHDYAQQYTSPRTPHTAVSSGDQMGRTHTG